LWQTIRALGWAIKILWIVTLLLPVTVAISMWELLGSKAIGIEEPTVSFYDRTLHMSTPFYINNNGFYDLSDINVTIRIINKNNLVTKFSKLYANVPAKSMLNTTYDVSVSLEELGEKNKELLTQNANLDLTITASLRVAYAIGFEIAANTTIEWGAPFNNLTISNIVYLVPNNEFLLFLSFENAASFPVSGELVMDAVNARDEVIGTKIQPVNVDSGTQFQSNVTIPIDPSRMIGPGVFHVSFLNFLILETEWS